MKQVLFIITALLLLAGGILLSIKFEEALYFFVLKLGLSWVWSSILIRLLVALCFIVALKQIFNLFNRLKQVKNWIVALIGIVPGFFLSFGISPIYDIDYGMLDDKLKIEELADLSADTNETYLHNGNYELIAFLDIGCAHCKMALKKLNANILAGQTVPVQLFFHNDPEDVQNFLASNNGENITHHNLQNEEVFVKHAGYEFPSIFLINPQGETSYHWVGDEMNYSALDYLLSLEQ